MNKEELIIQAAIEILARENFHTMRTADIAQTAGVAEGTLYRYFSSKRDLFVAVLRTITSRLEQTFVQGVSPAQDWKENIMMLGRNFFHHHQETAAHYRIMYKAFSEVEDQEIKGELARVFSSGMQTIREMLEWDQNIQSKASREKLDLAAMILWGLGDMLWKRQELWDGDETALGGEMRHIIRGLEALLLE